MSKESNAKVEKYYNDSTFFYSHLWGNTKNLAMHMGFWDDTTKNLHQALINENKYVADNLQIEKGDKVLDAGCGMGGTAIWIAENYGAHVTGITITKRHIVLAEKYAKDRGVSELTKFEHKDFCETGFASETFDAIYGIESISYSENHDEFLNEAYRLLKKGGKLIVCDGYMVKRELTEEQQKDVDDVNIGWAMPGFSNREDFNNSLKNLHFQNVKFVDATEKVLKSSVELFKSSRWIHPILVLLERIHLTSKSNVLAEMACRGQYYMFKNKVVVYGIFTTEK